MIRRLHSVSFIVGVLFLIVAPSACGGDDPEAGPSAPNPGGKIEGAECTQGSECASLTCAQGKCTPVTGANPTNNTKDGDETDVDCGGKSAPACADGKGCAASTDCTSGTCKDGVCKSPAPDDGIKNGDETDVDCGGTTTKAPKCALTKGCAKNEDCVSSACSYAKKCVEYPSCVGHFGGDTCGAGETGAADAKHESCCATATNAAGLKVGKYQTTAGRMRAFVERYNGNLQQWAATNPTGWNAGWDDQLPASMDDALNALGPNGKRGCNLTTAGKGARTYWQPAVNGDPTDKSDFSKDVLDEKTLNCVSWYMSQALCVSDGGHLASSADLVSFVTNDGANSAAQWPWTPNDPSGYNEAQQDDRTVHHYSYATPNPPANMRMDGGGPLDRSFYIAPPGRRPEGYNKIGVADGVGNMLMWANNNPNTYVWTQSWEDHKKDLAAKQWTASDGPEGYYGIGGRCVYP